MSAISDSFYTFWQAVKPLVTGTYAFTLQPSAWQLEETAEGETAHEFPYYADLAAQGITSSDIVLCLIDEASISSAGQAALYSRPESITNAVRFRAKRIPASSVSGVYWRGRKLT